LSLRFHFGLSAIAVAAAAAMPTSGAPTPQIQLKTQFPNFCEEAPNFLPLVRIPADQVKPLNYRIPLYPPEALRMRIVGSVRLAVCIAPDGELRDLWVISGHPLLVRAVLPAASHWRFAPVRWRGDPAWAVTEIDVPFRLKSKGSRKNGPADEI
jgi:TonB family protein